MAPRRGVPMPALRGGAPGPGPGPGVAGGDDGFDRRALKWLRLRLYFLAGIFALGFGALVFRAVDLQVVQRDRFVGMAEDQALREVVLTPRRGKIMDRGGEALALSVDVDSVRADPSRIEDLPGTVAALSKALHLNRKKLKRRLSHGRYFAWVKRRVSPEEAARVRALHLPGIGLTREARRFYPHRELASHLLGFAGIDGRGLEGLELTLDDTLRGTARSASALRDARGGRLFETPGPDPEQLGGGSVTLTLDRTLQWITEKALDKAVREAKAKDGMAVVLDPRTGEILAAATRPTFNPNDPASSTRDSRRNRVVTDIYEPGSTFKVFNVASALEEGLVRPDEVFDCEHGAARIGGHTIHDSHPYDRLTVGEIVKVSSNIGSAKIAARLGKERLVEHLAAFGFGERTGVSLPGEQPGILRPADRLSDVGLATLSFGQGVSATPLQVASAIGAVANGGKLMRPFLVREVRDETGAVVEHKAPSLVRTVVSERTAHLVTRMMETVVGEGGTAPRAAVPGYRVAGKTGTSQKVDPVTRSYSVTKRVGSFVGFLPAEDPRLVILVVIDEPQGVTYGGVVAAPAFREIAEGAMRYLGVPPSAPLEQDEEAPAIAEVAPDEAEGAVLPAFLAPPPEGKTLVPDLSGMDVRRAVRLLAERHLEARPSGTGLVTKQTPHAGTIAAPGDSVELALSPTG